jgi:hypothetical protein
VCSWHLCTGGWSLRGDVRGTCPRSPCTVPAMCADVRHPRRRQSPLLAVPATGRKVVSWRVAPVLAGHPGGRVGRRVEGRGGCRSASCRGAAPSWWGRLLGGSSMMVECPTKVVPGACAAGRWPGRRRRRTPYWPRA